jgi:hypothetical protein
MKREQAKLGFYLLATGHVLLSSTFLPGGTARLYG